MFGDPLSLTIHDPQHSEAEERLITIGVSSDFNTLVVVHTDLESRIRRISARHATKRERKDYEEGI